MAWSNTLFYIAFLSQIFLMSYYFPKKLLERMQQVLTSYPPETYAKLYPKPIEYYKMGQLVFKYVNRFILLLGLVILGAVMFVVDHSTFADDGFISEAWPAALGMIQFLPLLFVELSEFSNFKQMREANAASTRTADLRRRNLSDVVSPALLTAAILFFAGAILADLFAHDFAPTWEGGTLERAITLIISNGLMAAIGWWNLFGRKLDPHQSADDRYQRATVTVKALLYISMAMSLFIAVTAVDDLYNLDFLDAVFMSVYFQAIALVSVGVPMNNIRLEEIDFEVYKSDAAIT